MTIRRIALLGGESTGKTSLARALSATLDEPWVAEYGRELTVDKSFKGGLVFDDLLAIAIEQLDREQFAAHSARHWLICDTTPLTTLFYSIAMFGKADPKLETLAQQPYDVTFLCDTDLAFEQDGWRADADFRDRQQQWYVDQLAARNIAYIRLQGSVDDRLAIVLATINAAD